MNDDLEDLATIRDTLTAEAGEALGRAWWCDAAPLAAMAELSSPAAELAATQAQRRWLAALGGLPGSAALARAWRSASRVFVLHAELDGWDPDPAQVSP
jgi:hypothetical protein